MKRGEKEGFFLPYFPPRKGAAGFFFGYEDVEFPDGFYSVVMASLVEDARAHLSCNGEEVDEKGRRLRDRYKTVSEMKLVKTSSEEGDLLRVELTRARRTTSEPTVRILRL